MRDGVEHVRTIHFSLVMVSAAIGIAAVLTREGEVSRALEQLRAVHSLVQAWNPQVFDPRLTETIKSIEPSEGRWNLPGTRRRPALALSVERRWTLLPSFDSYISTFQYSEISEHAGPGTLLHVSAPENLSEFVETWNALQRIVIVVADPGYSGKVSYEFQDDERVRVQDGHPPNALRCGDTGAVKLVLTRVDKTDSPSGYAFDGSCVVGRRDWTVTVEAVPRDEIVLNLQPVLVSPRTGATWTFGTFRTSFPELTSVTTNISDLSFDKLLAVLEAESQRAPDRIELFGTRLPPRAVANWGPVLIVILQTYLLTHLRALRQRSDSALDIAWVGLYDEVMASMIVVTSIGILPGLTLGVVFWKVGLSGVWSWVFAVSVGGASGVLGALSVHEIRRIRRRTPTRFGFE